jgi:hypothetical protein
MMHATVCRLQARLVWVKLVFGGCSLVSGDAVKIIVSREGGGGGVGGRVDVWWWGLRDGSWEREGLSETAELIDERRPARSNLARQGQSFTVNRNRWKH